MSLSKPSRESPRESLDPEDRPITLPTGEIVVPVVNSFPSLIRVAFMDMIQADDYVSKDRLAPDQWARTHVFLDNPKTKAMGKGTGTLRVLPNHDMSSSKIDSIVKPVESTPVATLFPKMRSLKSSKPHT